MKWTEPGRNNSYGTCGPRAGAADAGRLAGSDQRGRVLTETRVLLQGSSLLKVRSCQSYLAQAQQAPSISNPEGPVHRHTCAHGGTGAHKQTHTHTDACMHSCMQIPIPPSLSLSISPSLSPIHIHMSVCQSVRLYVCMYIHVNVVICCRCCLRGCEAEVGLYARIEDLQVFALAVEALCGLGCTRTWRNRGSNTHCRRLWFSEKLAR